MIMRLNEQPYQVDGKSVVAEVIDSLEIHRRRYAVEENEKFIPRNSHDDHHLAIDFNEKEIF